MLDIMFYGLNAMHTTTSAKWKTLDIVFYGLMHSQKFENTFSP